MLTTAGLNIKPHATGLRFLSAKRPAGGCCLSSGKTETFFIGSGLSP